MKFGDFVKVKSLESPQGFRENLERLGLPMPCDDEVLSGEASPLAAPITVDGMRIGNRFAVHPMEGWDALEDGRP
ncbi:MAG: NADH:flavin oxidoreductase, partial [Comamonadaceae bacterium]